MTGITFNSSYQTGGAVDPWTISGVVLPAGELLFAIGWYNTAGSAQRTIAGISHPALSGAGLVTTQDLQSARAFYSEDVVLSLELWRGQSNGGTGDLIVDASDTMASPALAIYTAQQLGDALTLGVGQAPSGTTINCAASHSSAVVGVGCAYTRAGSAADITVSPWTRDALAAIGTNSRFASASSSSTQGGTITFSSDVALTAGLGMIVLFGAGGQPGLAGTIAALW